MKIANLCLLLIVLLTSFHCTKPNDPEIPSEDKTNLSIEVEDVSCKEAWIKLKIDKPSEVKMFINDKETNQFHLSSDTLIYLDTLLPNKSYKIEAAYLKNETLSEKTSAIAQTMDTTSHAMAWEIFYLGDVRSTSWIADVAVINENNIWAVGEINTKDTEVYDSLGNWVPPYNVAHWDGNKWELMRLWSITQILYPGAIGSDSLVGDGRTLCAFSENDVWIAAGSLFHYDGKKWTQRRGAGASVYKMWASSPKNMYFVGTGFVTHFDGINTFTVKTPKDLPIYDIYGDFNKRKNDYEIYAASGRNYPPEKQLLSITGKNVTEISSYPIRYDITGIWFKPNKHYFLVGAGIYEKTSIEDSLWRNKPLDITRYATSVVRGNDVNDVFVTGAFGEMLHFNGISWKSYIDQTRIDGSYGNLSVKGNVVAAAGSTARQGVVIIGKR